MDSKEGYEAGLRFVKVINEEALNGGRIVIPRSFAHKFLGKIPNPSYMNVNGMNGGKWMVKVMRVNGEMVMGKGWSKFAMDAALWTSDVVMFKYVGRVNWNVILFRNKVQRSLQATPMKRECCTTADDWIMDVADFETDTESGGPKASYAAVNMHSLSSDEETLEELCNDRSFAKVLKPSSLKQIIGIPVSFSNMHFLGVCNGEKGELVKLFFDGMAWVLETLLRF